MSWDDVDCHMRKYIVDGSLAANVTGAWVPAVAGYRTAVVTAQWAGTSTPDGEFYIQGTNENPAETTSPTAYTYYVDEGIFTTATLSSGVISVDSASAGNFSVTFEPIHPWIRLIYVSTDGGAAGALQAQICLRVH